MNEVLDPTFSAEESMTEEKNLLENAETQEVENIEGATEEPHIVEKPLAEEGSSEEENLTEDPVSESDDEVEVDVPVSEISEQLTKSEIIDQLKELVDKEVDTVKNKVESLKQAFYKLKKAEIEAAKQAFVEAEGEEAEFQAPKDALEDELKPLLHKFKERKAHQQVEEDKQKEINLAEKRSILEELKKLTESQDDFNKIYNEFRHLQQRWKEIKLVPQSAANDLWKEYQRYSEVFYDLVKINNEMREYDFKKNLEMKIALCESVERLNDEPDTVSAFHQLQKLHQEWREIGPVAKELREEIWNRFKSVSSAINKKHQDFFENLRGGEQTNLDAKTVICEKIEAINYDELTTFKGWEEKNKYVLSLQQEWKTIGFAPKKYNIKIFERFRAACDTFFQKKSVFYRQIKNSMELNLEKKKALCEKVEALKDSVEWKETTEKLIVLQREWKTIGAVSRKHSDAVWKRFIAACDYFFEQKTKNFASHKEGETENLRLKNELIDKINALDESLSSENVSEIFHKLVAEWNTIGFVPFKEKEKIHKKYREAVDKYFDRMKIDKAERRLESFKSNLSDIGGGDKSKTRLLGERDKLMRTFEKLKSDIQTYENNIGFLSVSSKSKGGGGLVSEMNHKINDLKAELELVVKKIQAIDDNLDSK